VRTRTEFCTKSWTNRGERSRNPDCVAAKSTQAIYVAILYLALRSLDGYVFTPLVQERTVNIPPALTISSQLIMGVLLGAWGLLLATPLAAAAMVLINKLYVQQDGLDTR